MRHKLFTSLITLFSISFLTSAFANTANSPAGYWKTIDDVTGKPKSIIKIWETPNHQLMGQVVKIWPRPGYDQHELCAACTDDKHNQPIVGMVIMHGLKEQDNEWGNGKILDPMNGKTYGCIAHVSEGGKKLNVHGYLGLPLFGRSQTWERVNSAAG